MAEKEEEQQSTCVNDTKSFLWTSFSFLLTDIIQCKGISTVSFPNILKSTQLHYLLFYNDVRMYRFYHFTSHISFNSNSSPYPLQHSLLSYKVQYFFSVHPFIPAALYPSIPDGVWFVSNECTGNVSTPTRRALSQRFAVADNLPWSCPFPQANTLTIFLKLRLVQNRQAQTTWMRNVSLVNKKSLKLCFKEQKNTHRFE